MRVTLDLLRDPVNGDDFLDLNDKRVSKVFFEYREVWEKDDGDEEGKTRRRIFQYPTGRQFRFVDTVTPEFLEDLGYDYRTPLGGMHHIVDPCTFVVHRFVMRCV